MLYPFCFKSRQLFAILSRELSCVYNNTHVSAVWWHWEIYIYIYIYIAWGSCKQLRERATISGIWLQQRKQFVYLSSDCLSYLTYILVWLWNFHTFREPGYLSPYSEEATGSTDRGSNPCRGMKFILPRERPDRLWWPTQLFLQWISGLFPGTKRPGRDNLSLSSSVDVKY